MTKFSEKMKKEGKINTQQALYYLEGVHGIRVTGKEREAFMKRMRKEVPGQKTGEGKGAFWYYKIPDLRLFAYKIQKEVQE